MKWFIVPDAALVNATKYPVSPNARGNSEPIVAFEPTGALIGVFRPAPSHHVDWNDKEASEAAGVRGMPVEIGYSPTARLCVGGGVRQSLQPIQQRVCPCRNGLLLSRVALSPVTHDQSHPWIRGE